MNIASKKYFYRTLFLLTLSAFFLRFWFCVTMIGEVNVISPLAGTDMATYLKIASKILEAKQFPEVFYYQPFYSAIFLPICLLIGFGSVWGLFLMQSLLGALTVWFTGLTTADLFGRKAALFAALLILFSRFLIFYTPFMLIATLQSFWMILIVYCSLYAYRKNLYRWWFLAAFISGFACLTRGNLLLLFPGIIALFIYKNFAYKSRIITGTVLLCLFFYLPQLPFSIHNYNAAGEWTGPSTAQNAVLALGNNPEAPAGGLANTKTYHIWMSKADRSRSDYVSVPRQMAEWFFRAPAAYLELKWRMFLLFWDHREVPNNISIDEDGQYSYFIHFPFLIDFGLIAVMAIAGFFATFSLRNPRRLFLYFMIIIYALSIVLFYILARFRLPVVPLLAVFAGGYFRKIFWMWKKFRTDRKIGGRLYIYCLQLSAACFIVYYSYDFYQIYLEKHVMCVVRPDGVQVKDKDFFLTYDHGPRSVGGWSLMPLDKKITVQKEFVLDPDLDTDNMDFFLIIPITATKGSHLRVEIPGNGIKDFFVTKEFMDVEPVSIRVPPPHGEKRVKYRITLRVLKGEFLTSYDKARDYGRSKILSGNSNTPHKKMEFCFALMGRRK